MHKCNKLEKSNTFRLFHECIMDQEDEKIQSEFLSLILHETMLQSHFKHDYKWRPPGLSELTPMIFNIGLTHFGSEASKYQKVSQ